MARQIEQRVTCANLARHADAGHAVFGLPMALDDPRLTAQGGTPKGAAAARADSWQKAIAFLKANLKN